MAKQYRAYWKEAEGQIRDTRESKSAEGQQLVESASWSTRSCTLQMRARLQLEALRMSQEIERKTLIAMQQTEHEIHRLQDCQDAEPVQLNKQWKKQVPQAASYKAGIHALQTELMSVQEKSEPKPALNAKMVNMDPLDQWSTRSLRFY